MSKGQPHFDAGVWLLLGFLSLLWGGSFLFVGIAIKEIPPPVLVMARVLIAAAVLIPVHFAVIGRLPGDRRSWVNFAVLGVINNAVPFTLITTGQTMLASGLASVINATTPLFGVALMAAAGQEPLEARKMAGIMVGIAGVVMLKGESLFGVGTQGLGIVCALGAAFCYGLSSLWAKLRLKGIRPLTLATGQLMCSAAVMTVIGFTAADPSVLLHVSTTSWLAVLGLALLATSLAYLVFFRIIERAGPANVQLVTMMIPVSAILMGYAVLGETLEVREILGALIIIGALAIIDGRALQLLKPGHNAT